MNRKLFVTLVFVLMFSSILFAQSDSIIEDLAYIRARASVYTDDADPEHEGISIRIRFFDSHSELIRFSGIPFGVRIELYGYRNARDSRTEKGGEIVYEGYVTLDHSMTLGKLSSYIRITFEDLGVDQNMYYKYGSLKVMVETPSQGGFSSSDRTVQLYTSEYKR